MIRRRLIFLALVPALAISAVAGAQTPSPDALREMLGRGTGPAAAPSALPDAVRRAFGDPSPYETGAAYQAAPLATLQDGPVDPERYHLGPGDELTVYYRGKTAATQRVSVNPEGSIYLPDAGGMDVGGRTLAAARTMIRDRVARVLRDVSVDIHLTRVRAFKVTVGGEVARPGVYTADGSTRVFELIRLAGGITDSAAVRDIRLLGADGAVVRSIDLLPLLLGAAGADLNPNVSAGRALFVPRRAAGVTVLGAVQYPGTYDLRPGNETAAALLDLLRPAPDAVADRIEVGRFSADGRSEVMTLDRSALSGETVTDGMVLFVPRRGDFLVTKFVEIAGEVAFPGPYAITAERTTLRDLVTSAGGFSAEAVPARVRLVRPVAGDTLAAPIRRLAPFGSVPLTMTEREVLRSRGVSGYRAVQVNLENDETGPALEPGDRVFVPRNGGWVEVTGRVKSPGFYPYREGWSARDYVAGAGGWADRADKGQTRVGGGPGDNFRTARDAGPPEPGDQVWVPEKTPRNTLEIARDAFLIIAQVATVILVVDQVTRN